MTALNIGAAGALFFLILTFFTYTNKRFGRYFSYRKISFFLLPLIAFAWVLSTQLYIPFKGNGCSFADNQNIIRPDIFSADKKSGILLVFIDGFGDCRVSVSMKNGRNYSGKSFNSVFAIVLPADSGRINEILMGEKGDTLFHKIKFEIKPGKLSYVGSIINQKDFAGFPPAFTYKAANFTFKAPTENGRTLLKSWEDANRLLLTTAIQDRISELRKNYGAAASFVGLQFGYRPFSSTSLNGKVQSLTPEEVLSEYKQYAFMIR